MSAETIEQNDEQVTVETAVTHASPESMFRWSAYVHVGDGAPMCERREEGDKGLSIVGVGCEDPNHFHAWVRLPNQFQHREITQKASAAQARKTRLYRDDDTDASVILDAEMDELRVGQIKEPVITALLQRDSTKDYMEAMMEARAEEEFEHVVHDQNRLAELEAMPEDERDADEYRTLVEHLDKFTAAVEAKRNEMRAVKHEAMSQLELEDLVLQLRQHRVEQEGTEEYLHVYGTWEIIAGTYTVERDPTLRKHSRRHFTEPAQLIEESPEVIDAVKDTMDDLRATQQRAVTEGNG